MEEIINAAMATLDKQPVEAARAEIDTAVSEEQQQGEAGEVEQSEGAGPEQAEPEVIFPKKAINAISRRDKQIGKLRAQVQQYQAELEQLRSLQSQAQQAGNQADNGPDESQYDSAFDYVKALIAHEINKGKEPPKQAEPQQQQQANPEQAQWVAERTAQIQQKAADYAAKIPDFEQLVTEYADVLDAMPNHIEDAALHIQDPPLAFYTLAKEGKLESLYTMHPYQAVQVLTAAEMRGQTMLRQRQVSKAPQPMTGVKGAGAGSSLKLDNYSDIQKWLNS